MIQAHELRIGNWVYGATGKPMQIKGKDIDAIADHPEWDIENPIELTPSILEKCGFHKIATWHQISLSDQFSLKIIDDGAVIAGKENSWDILLDHIKYLHQLQNLYYALTGTEIICKL